MNSDSTAYSATTDPDVASICRTIGSSRFVSHTEPAIAATYAMLGKADPLSAARAVVGGYHAVHRLSDEELRALPFLVRLRLAVSVANSARRRADGSRKQPGAVVRR